MIKNFYLLNLMILSFFISGGGFYFFEDFFISYQNIYFLLFLIFSIFLLKKTIYKENILLIFLYLIYIFLNFSTFMIFNTSNNNDLNFLYPLLMNFLIFFVAFIYADNLSRISGYENFIFKLSWFFTFIFFIYGLWFNILNVSNYDFMRLRGPLAGSATIHTLIIIILSVHIYFFEKKVYLSLLGVFVCLFLLYLADSRAGYLCLILFFLLYFLRDLSLKKVVSIISLFVIMLFSINYFNFDRLNSLEDDSRSTNFETAISIFKNSGIFHQVFGVGYGEVWPWYLYNTGILSSNLIYIFINHPKGYTLQHPHSTILGVMVESGILGLIIFSILFLIFFIRYFKIPRGLDRMIGLGFISILPSILVDSYFILSWNVSFYLWFFFFLVICRSFIVEK